MIFEADGAEIVFMKYFAKRTLENFAERMIEFEKQNHPVPQPMIDKMSQAIIATQVENSVTLSKSFYVEL